MKIMGTIQTFSETPDPDGSRINLTAGFWLVNLNHLKHQQVSPDSGCSGVRQVQNAIDITVLTDVGELDYTDYY